MKSVFPYVQRGDRYYPTVDVAVKNRRRSITVKALIDSGASFSVFRQEIAEHLGIVIEKGKSLYLEGVGGRILGYAHPIQLAVGGKKFICPIVFSKEFSVSLNLLGRETFFQHFRITFDEKIKVVELE